MPSEFISLLNTATASLIFKRQSVFLDTNIWVELADQGNAVAVEARSLLTQLVLEGKIFCPVSFTSILELLLQEADSALRQAEVMELLSLNITLLPKENIWRQEVREFVRLCLEGRVTDVQQVKLERPLVFAPVMALFGPAMQLDYPSASPAWFINEMTPVFQQASINMSISSIVRMLSLQLPFKDWKSAFNPRIYAEVWKERYDATKSSDGKGNRVKARQVEEQSVLENQLVPIFSEEFLAQTTCLPPLTRFAALKRMEAYTSPLGNKLPKAVLKKILSMNRFVEVSTVAGLDPLLKSKANDFVDIENMIVPPLYTDVFVAHDGWVKATVSDSAVRATNEALCLFSLPDLISYCETLRASS